MGLVSFTCSIELPVNGKEFITNFSMDEVNFELGPLVKMTAPTEWAARPVTEWRQGQQLFASWILLLGVIPIDRHFFYFRELVPERGFSEDSSSLMNRHWRHQRWVEPIAGGCRLTDSLEYQSRLPFLDRLMKPIYRLVFARRHRKLRSRYGVIWD